MALKTVDVTFQNLDSSEISLTDVSHYYDSDPTKVVSSLRDDKKKPSSFMADTTTANAQVRAPSPGRFGLGGECTRNTNLNVSCSFRVRGGGWGAYA